MVQRLRLHLQSDFKTDTVQLGWFKDRYYTFCLTLNMQPVQTRALEDGQMMPKLGIRDSAGNIVRLWILDKSLECYRNSDRKLNKETAFKLLYLIEPVSTCDNRNSDTKMPTEDLDLTRVPTVMFSDACDRLQGSTSKLPAELRQANGWNVAYIRHL